MENLWKDLLFALRGLRKRPGFALVAILTLTLGIGANTAIFSVTHAVLLAPLPYHEPDRLVGLWTKNDKKNLTQQPVSYPNLKDWKERNPVFAHVAGVRVESFSLVERDQHSAYLPFQQNTWPNALRTSFLVVRTDGDPNNYRAAIRQALRSVDPALPITQLRTMDEIIADSLSQRRFNTALLLVFAIVAALLAAVGVYGVMSYLVTQRTHELGVRMALGAQRGDILKLVAGGGAKLAALGITVGVTLALAMTRLMSGLLFGVGVTDPWTFVIQPVQMATQSTRDRPSLRALVSALFPQLS